MQYEVRITNQAQDQLRSIRNYIAQDLASPQAAADTLRALRDAMASFARMSNRVRLVDEEPWRSEGIRMCIVGNFLLYLWVNESEKTVQIIAVCYARRDRSKVLAQIDVDLGGF